MLVATLVVQLVALLLGFHSLRTLLQNKSLGAALSGPVEYPDALAAQGTAVAIIAWLRLRLTSLLEPPIVFPVLPP